MLCVFYIEKNFKSRIVKNMSNKQLTKREENFSQWYLDVITAADLAEHGDVKGTMIIKPYGYAIWERLQRILDDKIKETGHQNAYFPMFIPKSFFSKEAAHVSGFAKECAVVTHYRLKTDEKGELVVDPEAKLQEELIVRPTSETIIHSAFSRWIKSWRDLPILINQWANIVRWEMRTRLFLRTSEFLWQEGHTAHATEAEAEAEARKMLEVYKWLAQDIMAMPVIDGQKSEAEKFAGALRTYAIEAMMQDGKSLQAGTSHNLGQGFAKAFEVKFVDENNTQQYAWMTSWGVSTRLIGGLIMTHSDNKGLVLPPQLAPIQVVIIPIIKDDNSAKKVLEAVTKLKEDLQTAAVRVHVDSRDFETMGNKMYEWEKKGVPLRIEIGPRDVENKQVMLACRDQDKKSPLPLSGAVTAITDLLLDMQKSLFIKAQKRLTENSYNIDNYSEFTKKVENGGFFYAHWCGNAKCEEEIKQETKATIRCMPFAQKEEKGVCMKCNKDSKKRVIFARAY